MLHNILIGIHAFGGSCQFVAGCLLLVPSFKVQTHHRYLLSLFLIFLALMLVPLLAVIAVDWPELETAERVIFPALGVLALYMAFRAFQAYQILSKGPTGWRKGFTDHVGFNLISLFDGFVIVTAINLGAPGWLVLVIAALGVAGGIWGINTLKKRPT